MDLPPIEPAYVQATIQAESAGHSDAVSSADAKGLMQVEDATGREVLGRLQSEGQLTDQEYQPFDPDQNEAIGSRYLQEQLGKFGDKRLASAAYNAGPGKVAELQKEHGDSYEDIAAYLPKETQQYVSRVAGNYNKLVSNQNPDDQKTDDVKALTDSIRQAPNTPQGFAQALSTVVTKPDFDNLPFEDQASIVSRVYKSKNWGKQGYDVYKNVMDSLWNTAAPEERPDLNEIVGAPPVVPTGQDPGKVLDKWRSDSVQKLARQGVLPAAFGTHLDSYLDNATKAETDAYNLRNESAFGKTVDSVGNFSRSIGKGIISTATDPLAGAMRLGIGPFAFNPDVNDRQKRADEVEKLPEILGTPSKTYLYATDETGKLLLNQDGTPQTHPEAHASQLADSVGRVIGQTAGFLTGGAYIKAVSGGLAGAGVALGSANALSVAGSSFKTVYNDTNGDTEKAYTAAALAAPLGFIGEVGDLQVLSKTLSPVFRTMNTADQASYVARAWIKNTAIGAATIGGTDAVQQAIEIAQTGKEFNPERTEQAAVGGAIASGLVGTVHDYVSGKADYVVQQAQRANIDKALVLFRNSPHTVATFPVDGIPADLADLYGLTVAKNPDGSVTATKNVTEEPAGTLPELVSRLQKTYTPDEIVALGQRQGELAAKETRTPAEEAELGKLNKEIPEVTKPEYLNNVKAIEGTVLSELKADPGALFARWDPKKSVWENPETGHSAEFLKDVLNKRAEPAPTKDFSALENVRIVDEDNLKEPTPPQTAINPAAHEEGVNLQRKLDQVNTEILGLQNKKAATPKEDKEVIADLNQQLNEKRIEQRKAKADLLRIKPTLDTEEAARQAEDKQFQGEQKSFKKDKAALDRVRQKGLGATLTKEGKSTILLPSGLAPEVKEQVLAHEIGHALADKVTLDDNANKALDTHLQEIKDRGIFEKATDLAKRVFLPEIGKIVKVDDVPFSKLTGESKKAITSRRELLANQIGALMLKRAGVNLGDYKILPEIEDALQDTKLPDIKNPQPQKAITKIVPGETPLTGEAPSGGGTPPPDSGGIPINPLTGEQGETAYSKTVREFVPEGPATLYDKVSRIKGEAEADAFVNDVGVKRGLEIYRDSENHKLGPQQLVLLASALEKRTRVNLEKNPTSENQVAFNEASQARASAGTVHAQALALLSRFRNAETFPDFIAQVAKAYREAGHEPPVYTEYQLKELQAQWNKIAKLGPDNVLRARAVGDMFTKTLNGKQLTWADFLGDYMRTNLLSGLGTQPMVFASSAWMGPIFTALGNPFLGGGLLWRSMFDILPTAFRNAENAFKGRALYNMYRGMNDLDYIKQTDIDTNSSTLAKVFTKFGNVFKGGLNASHVFASTLAETAYLAKDKYNELKAKYGDDVNRFTAEVAKIRISKDQLDAAYTQARKEAASLGTSDPSDIAVRAYQIVRQASATPEQLANAADWSLQVSHLGKPISPIHQVALGLINSPAWNKYAGTKVARVFIQPFGNALIRLSDLAFHFVPGAAPAIDAALGGIVGKESWYKSLSPAQQQRLVKSQMIGTVMGAFLLGLTRSGALVITGDEEKQEGKHGGEPAQNRKDFAEAKQVGTPAFSIMLPGGKYGVSYKDFPGLNAIAYGIYRTNKALDTGGNLMDAAAAFYRGSVSTSIPFFGNSTLESPVVKFVSDLMDSNNEAKLQKSLESLSVSAAKMLTPGSGFLRDVQHIYDSTPEETNQELAVKMFKDVPGLSEALGSRGAIDRIGEPIQRTPLERIPGVGRLITEQKEPSDAFWQEVKNKNLIIPEMPTTIKFTDSDYKQTTSNYKLSEEDRIRKAGSLALAPDEWNKFRAATGPYIKSAVQQLMDINLDHDTTQDLIKKRVNAIDKQAMERYIRTGEF